MDKQCVIKQLKEIKQLLFQQYGIIKPGVFGSIVRGEATKHSDVDILIDFDTDKETFYNFISVCELLQKAFGKQRLDIVTRKGLSPFISDSILNEVEYV